MRRRTVEKEIWGWLAAELSAVDLDDVLTVDLDELTDAQLRTVENALATVEAQLWKKS